MRDGMLLSDVTAAYETEIVERGREAVISSGLDSKMVLGWELLKGFPPCLNKALLAVVLMVDIDDERGLDWDGQENGSFRLRCLARIDFTLHCLTRHRIYPEY